MALQALMSSDDIPPPSHFGRIPSDRPTLSFFATTETVPNFSSSATPSMHTHHTVQNNSLLRDIFEKQQTILERLEKIEKIINERLPPSQQHQNRTSITETQQPEIHFPMTGFVRDASSMEQSIDLTEENERNKKRFRPNSNAPSNTNSHTNTYHMFSTTTNPPDVSITGSSSTHPLSSDFFSPEMTHHNGRPRFSPIRIGNSTTQSTQQSMPTIHRPNENSLQQPSTWQLNIKTDQPNDFQINEKKDENKPSPIPNEKEKEKDNSSPNYHPITIVEIQVKLPVQQLDILPALRNEVAKKCKLGWKDINLFLIKSSSLSQKDQLVGIQNHSSILVRKKATPGDSDTIHLRIITSTSSNDFLRLAVLTSDFIWEVKYQS